jgi:hypothetical protein
VGFAVDRTTHVERNKFKNIKGVLEITHQMYFAALSKKQDEGLTCIFYKSEIADTGLLR